MNSIVFATLKNTFDKNPVNHEMPLEQFVEFVCNTSKRLSVDPNWTKEEYDAAKIKQKAIAPVGGRRKDADLESSFVPFDFDHLTREQYRTVVRTFKSAPFFNIMHTTASDGHACKNGDRALRVLIPTATVFSADDTWMIQRVIMDELALPDSLRDHCTEDSNRMVYLPHRESKITVTEGSLLRPRRYIARGEEMGLTKRERKELVADEHGLNADIAHFCEAELGLDALSSGRGYEVPCPNEHLHTGKGSTSIMLDGKEVRFVCQHTNNGACTELNRHQHLALRMCGLPDELNVDKHPISLSTIKAALPDLPDEEVEELHRTENEESVTCSLEDLEDEPEVEEPQYNVVDGLIKSNESFYICAPSHTGKSTFNISLDAAIAAHQRYAFAGAEVAEGHAFIFAGEGAGALNRNKKALEIALNEELDRLHIIDMEGGNLLDEAWRAKAIIQMRRLAGDGRIVKVTFDTLQTCIPGLDENDNKLMKHAAQALNSIAKKLNAAVGAMVHPKKSIDEMVPSENDMKPKGGSDFHNSIDNAMFLHRPDNARPSEINLYQFKNRNGNDRQKPIGFVIDETQIAEEVIKPAPTHKFMAAPKGYEDRVGSGVTAARDHMGSFVNFTPLKVFIKEVEGMAPEQKQGVANAVSAAAKLTPAAQKIIATLQEAHTNGEESLSKREIMMRAFEVTKCPTNLNNAFKEAAVASITRTKEVDGGMGDRWKIAVKIDDRMYASDLEDENEE